MGILEIKLLGGFNLLLDNLPLNHLKSQKGRALFCYLAVTGKRVSRSALAGLLWPDMPETKALMNLRKVLTRIKPLFPFLKITRTELSFRQDSPHWLDIAEFERQAEITSDIACMQDAVTLYQGDFLDGFYLDHVPIFEEWMMAQRARLRELAMSTLDTLITQLSDQGAYEAAICYTRQMLTIEPWHERAYRELMRFLAYTGQRSAALMAFETCRGLLVEELGVEPDPITVQLYEQVKKGELDGVVAGGSSPSTYTTAPPVYNLPVQTTPFIGRDRELAALSGYLSNPDIRLITILGPGGMGKTRLGLAAAEAQLDGLNPPPLFPQGVFFISLARLESPDLMVPAIAEAIDFHFSANTDLKEQLLNYLRPKKILLVLDNFEHLLDGVSLVDDILNTAPSITLLVTSRVRLNRRAEQLFKIEGLRYPKQETITEQATSLDLASYDALQLFQENARRVRPTFSLTVDNLPIVLDICSLVDGMPLGIVLAATWVGSLSSAEVIAEMRRDLDFLATEMGDVPQRQRSLRAAFKHSWRLLSEREQNIYQQLSVFRGGFTRLAAQAVTSASFRDMQVLVNNSLLVLLPNGRYEIHELLRQYAAEQLAEKPDLETEVSDRHCSYYCQLLHKNTDHWHTSQQLETLALVKKETDNIELAWRWALKHSLWEQLALAFVSWTHYLRWQGRYADGESFCGAVIQGIEKEESDFGHLSPSCTRLWAVAMAWYGDFVQAHSTAITRFERSLALLERPELKGQDLRREKAFALQGLAKRYYDLDRRKERGLLDQSLYLYQALDDSWGIAQSLISLGSLEWGTGHYAKAQQHLESGLDILKNLGESSEQVSGLNSLAWIHQHLGDLEKAEGLRREVLDLVELLGDRHHLADQTANLAFTLVWRGKFSEADQWAEKSLCLGQEYGRWGDEGYLRLAIGFTSLYAGNYEKAQEELSQALAQTREIGSQGVRATVHWSLGCLALVRNSYQEAEAEFITSRQLYQQVQDNFLGLALSGLSYAYYFMEDRIKTRQNIVASLKFALSLKDYMHIVVTLPIVALFLSDIGELRRAIQIWELARTQPFIAKSSWHKQVVEPHILAVVSDLSSQEVEIARSFEQEMTLWETAEILLGEIELVNDPFLSEIS